ncbi:MAG: S9 family peptidase [Wenzhouxiangellaceae bacterium]|nr:S9 family peptidase [Wenzhouxiangellaceae bacterium]MBS3824472.1 S9 family peptidase [Wenzhouxiangellaceae bacterium]
MNAALRSIILLMTMNVFIAGCQRPSENHAPQPPDAAQREHLVAAPAGERNDPYYWLRDDSRKDPEVLALLEAENTYTRAMLAETRPLIEDLAAEMRARIPDEETGAPFFDGGYWYYTRYEAGGEYPVHARREGSMEGPEQVLLDGNRMGEEEDYFRIGGWDVSPDAKKLLWLQDVVGRRQFRLLTRDIDSGEVVDTGAGGVSSATWAADGNSIFYVENHPETLRSFRVKRHFPGQDRDDEVLYEETDTAYYTSVGRTRSDRFNYIFVRSTAATEMHVIDSADPAARFEVFFPREHGHEYSADHVDDHWVIRTNWEAPNFRIMRAAQTGHADRSAWTDLISPRAEVFVHEFDAFESHLAVAERADGLRRLRILDYATGQSRVIEFEEAAYVAQLGRNREPASDTLQFIYTSMTTPRNTYELDLRTGDRKRVKQLEVAGGFERSDYRTRRLWAEARDDTRIPVSLVWHKDTPLDGSAPLYQYGYGSYGSSMEPAFSSERISLLDRGFVYAIAHVRGGQEMGREWYEQGRLLNKVNTFTDFIDVRDHLVGDGLVDGERVFAMGGSAGGLLVGAVANMAPEKFAGIVAHVPFVDVVTTMLDESIPLTTNEFDEWGNPEKPEFYRYMLSYSPYDNVSRQEYPAMLVTTGLWDSQVQYWEPAKWVARLRDYKTDQKPLLLHVNMDAGHGGKSGRFRRLEQTAMEYAFVLERAGLN